MLAVTMLDIEDFLAVGMVVERVASPGMQMADADRLYGALKDFTAREPLQRAPVEGLDWHPIGVSQEGSWIRHRFYTARKLRRSYNYHSDRAGNQRGIVMQPFEGERIFLLPPERLWPKLRDAAFLARCIPDGT